MGRLILSPSDRSGAPVAVGLLGCGAVAQRYHLPALDAISEAEVVAMADPDPAALARAAAGRDAATYPDPQGVLDDPRVEVVAVCAPSHLHEQLATAAATTGRHVFVEKPPALTSDGCGSLAVAAEAVGRHVMVGFTYRWHGLVRAARALLANQELGSVCLMRTTFTAPLTPGADGWRVDPIRGGGVTTELGIHLIDLWRFLLDTEPQHVRLTRNERDTAAVLSGRTPSGTVLSAEVSSNAGRNQEIVLIGTDATLTVRLDRYDGLELVPGNALPGDLRLRAGRMARLARAVPGLARSHLSGGWSALAFQAQWRHVAAVVRTDAAPQVTLEDGRRAVELLEAARGANAAPVTYPAEVLA